MGLMLCVLGDLTSLLVHRSGSLGVFRLGGNLVGGVPGQVIGAEVLMVGYLLATAMVSVLRVASSEDFRAVSSEDLLPPRRT
jgi:hypothetical protein